MKTIITAFLALLGTQSFSQNGGQFFQNNLLRIQYMSYFSGVHTFKVVNKQSCIATIRTKVDQDPSVDLQISANDSTYVTVARDPGNVKFRSKAETACVSNPDMGWLEINTSDFALNLVEDNSITISRGPHKLEISLINGIVKSSYGTLNYIEHIKVYGILGTVKYDDLEFVKRSNATDINRHLKTGLNIVEVIIVTDNGPQRFVFKYQK